MKIITIIGARPQFIKAAPVSHALNKKFINELIINTGQHYDFNMSNIFFKELNIPHPKYNLKVGSGSHGVQTGKIMCELDEILTNENPDGIIVYGDTNSTLAGALSGSKLHFPIYHVESGLRSFNKKMPEETNRIVTDHVSNLLLCPSLVAKKNLLNEGLSDGVHVVGDVMFDIFLKFEQSFGCNIDYGSYAILTLHRAENTNSAKILSKRLEQISKVDSKIIFPIHPRTKKSISNYSIDIPPNIILIEPVSWVELMGLVKKSQFVITDSGGLQKEAFWHKKKCYTLRSETEWIETLSQNANTIIREDESIVITSDEKCDFNNPYGDGNASFKIAELIIQKLQK